jgi:enoyl-CoA hydratase
MSAPEGERVRVDRPGDGIGRITLARADRRNAQDQRMLRELDAAFSRAMQDDEIRVVVLAADGEDFSSGHDLSDLGFIGPNADTHLAAEQELYLGFCRRWRELPKPTIAQVHGRVIAGGLMLVWPCDLVIASEDATFSDPVVAFGISGTEFFVHPWELGHRKAKEMLFRGNALTAEECRQLGMVNQVVPRAELGATTLRIAQEIAAQPPFGVKLAKLAVNQSMDIQGQDAAVRAAFGLHHLGHAAARAEHGQPFDPAGAQRIKNAQRANR